MPFLPNSSDILRQQYMGAYIYRPLNLEKTAGTGMCDSMGNTPHEEWEKFFFWCAFQSFSFRLFVREIDVSWDPEASGKRNGAVPQRSTAQQAAEPAVGHSAADGCWCAVNRICSITRAGSKAPVTCNALGSSCGVVQIISSYFEKICKHSFLICDVKKKFSEVVALKILSDLGIFITLRGKWQKSCWNFIIFPLQRFYERRPKQRMTVCLVHCKNSSWSAGIPGEQLQHLSQWQGRGQGRAVSAESHSLLQLFSR